MTRWNPKDDRTLGLCLGGLIVLLVLACGGWNNVPMNDDFSYARTTEALARTGRIVFNGWGTPLMLPQMAVGAAVIRVLGFSWWALHLVGFASAWAYVSLAFLLARRCGVSRGFAVGITLVLGCSPFVLGTVPTYMTDLPGAALGLGSLLLLVGATEDGFDRRRFLWAGVLGIVAGTDRQSLWVPFLGAIWVVAWLRPAARPLTVWTSVVLLAVAVPLIRWFGSFPYTVPVRFDMGIQLMLAYPPVAFRAIYKFLNLIGFFTFPMALLALRGRSIRWLLMGALMVVALLPIFHPMGTRGMPLLGERYMLTYYGQYFTSAGIVVGGVDGFARKLPAMPPWVVFAVVVQGALGVAAGGYLFLEWWDRLLSRKRPAPTGGEIAGTALSVYAALQILAFLPWLAQMNMFDRYLIPLLPALLIFHRLQAADARPVWVAGWWVASGIYCTYGIASSIDYFGATRARETLHAALRADGVDPRNIDGGFEFSADTQVVAGGHTNNPAIARPADAHDPDATGRYLAYLPEMFPALDARWRLSTSVDLSEVEVPPAREATWWSPMPPFRHRMGAYRILRSD